MSKQYYISKSSRLRSTPFSDQVEEQGAKSYTVYNHMLLSTVFESVEADCNHLKEFVQIWDVSVERQVEISGPDSYKLVQMMTCRDLSKAKDDVCYYAPIIDDKGFMINDPLIMKVDENKWWISIADSDVLLFAKGLATGFKLDLSIHEPNVNPLAVQGPKSFELMEKIFGSSILDMTIKDNVLECGMDTLISFSDEIEYPAKDHLKKLSTQGIKKSLTGMKIYTDSLPQISHLPIFFDGDKIGELRSVVYSPKFKCCLGIVMIEKDFQSKVGFQELVIDNTTYKIEISTIPFS